MESEENIQKCPNCSAIIPKNKKFCTQCGSEIINKPGETVPGETVPGETVPEETVPEETVQTCPNCSAILAENQKFCSECGSEITNKPEETTCPNCSAILAENQKFCTECGSDINQEDINKIPKKIGKDSINDLVNSVMKGGEQFVKDVDVIIKKSRSNKKEPKNLQTEQKPQSQTQDPFENELEQLKYLEKLAELKDKGLISEEEFKKKKEDILKL